MEYCVPVQGTRRFLEKIHSQLYSWILILSLGLCILPIVYHPMVYNMIFAALAIVDSLPVFRGGTMAEHRWAMLTEQRSWFRGVQYLEAAELHLFFEMGHENNESAI